MAEGGIGLARSQESVDDPDSTSQVRTLAIVSSTDKHNINFARELRRSLNMYCNESKRTVLVRQKPKTIAVGEQS